jgi:ADP-heptose:LPS heptosyltransferase
MIKTYFTKLGNLIVYLITRVIISIIVIKKIKLTQKTLLLIRLDSIGDYILVRNFFRSFKDSTKFNNYKITLCGNILWKELAETFDGDIIDEFIWIDRKKFYSNITYKYKILKQIHCKGFEVCIDTTFSREILFGDAIVKTSSAREKIGSSGAPDSYVVWKRKLFSNNFYSRLIPVSEENIFEFNRNKNFFEQIINEKINLPKPFLDTSAITFNSLLLQKYIIIFPGANDEKRIWDINNFVDVGKFILSNTSFLIVVCGSQKEEKLAGIFTIKLNGSRIINFTGKITLVNLVKIISNAEFLISNETGAVHIAAATGTKFLCISNGNHLGRFNPYPEDIYKFGTYIYPDSVVKILEKSGLTDKYRFNSDEDINSILPGSVIKKLEGLLTKEKMS